MASSNSMRALTGLGVLVLLLLAWGYYSIGPNQSGIVKAGLSPDGREYFIVQTYRDIIEPYQVSFYLREPNGDWRWHYLEHEGDIWRNAEVEFRGTEIDVYRHGELYRVIDNDPESLGPLTEEDFRNNNCLPADWDRARVAARHHARFDS